MKKLMLGLVAALGLFAFVVPAAYAQGDTGTEKPPEAKKAKKHKKSKKAKKSDEGAAGAEGGAADKK